MIFLVSELPDSILINNLTTYVVTSLYELPPIAVKKTVENVFLPLDTSLFPICAVIAVFDR